MNIPTHAYVIFAPCGCPNELIADLGQRKVTNLGAGRRVERMTLDEAKALAPKMYGGCEKCAIEAGS